MAISADRFAVARREGASLPRVLMVNADDGRGGAARIAGRLVQGLAERGCTTAFGVGRKAARHTRAFAFDPTVGRGPLERVVRRHRRLISGALRRLPVPAAAHELPDLIATPGQFLRERLGREPMHAPATYRLLDQIPWAPDIIHCHNLHGRYFDLRALPALAARAPVVLTLHDAWLLSGHCAHSFGCERWRHGCGHCPDLTIYPAIKRDATAANWRLKQRIMSATRPHVTAPCAWLVKRARSSLLAEGMAEAVVIPNGVDLDTFYPGDRLAARRRLGIPEAARVLLFVSNRPERDLWRDVSALEQVIATLRRTSGATPTLMIAVGAASTRRSDESGGLRYVAYQDDASVVADYYRSADVYYHPAIVDTFPTVLLEAQACGTPVVSTTVGGIPEIIVDHTTGLLTRKGDVASQLDHIQALLSRPEVSRRMSAAAAERARDCFDERQMVARYLDLYQRISRYGAAAAPA